MNNVLSISYFFALCVIAIALSSCNDFSSTPAQWHMVNVNTDKQGDAHLLLDNGIVTFIDAGRKSEADTNLIPYLQNLNINRIDNFFISHPHTDHTGGLKSLLENDFSIRKIYYNLPPEPIEDWNFKRTEFLELLTLAKNQGAIAIELSTGDRVKLGKSSIKVIYAYKQATLNNKATKVNDFSMLLRWEVAGWKALFTGDLGKVLGVELANNELLQGQLKADILKTPHHGVETIAPKAFFDAVAPRLHMVPSTKALWQHPRGRQVMLSLSQAPDPYCHNGLNGTVVLTLKPSVITSKSDRAAAACPDGPLVVR
jgi:competence protein ComEC